MNKLALGLYTPDFFLRVKGWMDGSLFKTAAPDPNSGQLRSAFLVSRQRRFRAASAHMVQQLEKALAPQYSKTADLMAELTSLERRLDEVIKAEKAAQSDPRSKKRNNAARLSLESRRDALISDLTKLDQVISGKELLAAEDLHSTASAMESKLAAYAHGALRRPADSSVLPPVQEDDCLTRYRKAHETEQTRRADILKEVYHNG